MPIDGAWSQSMCRFKVTVLPGDGIGPEIIEQALRVLKLATSKASDTKISIETHDFGGIAIDKHDKEAHAILMGRQSFYHLNDMPNSLIIGSVGGPKWGVSRVRPEQGLLRLRKELGVYANIRPCSFASESLVASSPLKPEIAQGTNIIVVRELIGGVYFGERQELEASKKSGDAADAWDTMAYSVGEVKRITRVAAKIALASNPPMPLHSIDKANVLASSRLWRKVVNETIHEEFPQLELDHHLVDAAAMIMVANPRKLNGVVLTENLFGDM